MSRLYIKQKVFSFGGHFTVKDENEQDKYIVEGSFLSIPKVFTIKDLNDQVIGTITKKVFSWLPKFFVAVDGKEELIIEKQLTFFKAKYQIDSEDLTIQGDWWDKQFTILRRGKVVAAINEKWFTWGDTFEVEVYDETLEHLVISVVIAIDFVKQEEAASTSSSS
ncbi:LURP-one-related/scramblase family protein [Enterococcus termitis]